MSPRPAQQITNIFMRCLLTGEEALDPAMRAEAVTAKGILIADVGFHPGRLKEARNGVRALIAQAVQNKFFKGTGGGASFLELSLDARCRSWCNIEQAHQLLLLSLAMGYARYDHSRESRSGVPYVIFNLEEPS